MDPELQKSVKLLVKMAILTLSLIIIYLLFAYVFPIVGEILIYIPILFLPFIIAIAIAVVIEPIVVFFETRLRMRRSLAVVFSLVFSVGGFIYLVSLAISQIVKELSGLYPLMLSYSDQVITKFVTAIGDFRLFYLQLDLAPELEKALEDNLQKASEILQTVANNSLKYLIDVFSALPGAFILILIAMVATFFIIKDRALLRTFFLQIIPGSARAQSRDVLAELFRALIGFLKAYSILISITAIITIVGLKILGISYIFTIGILVGILDILPILGPGTLFIPWIIWEIISGDTGFAVSLLVLYVIISVVRQFLEPKIIGDNIGLHPLATLISLYVGLQLGGIVGMIAGPVLLVIFIACYRVGVFNRFNWRKSD
ncbi:MAG: sporulation integral membrane protein YtvI [Syntrophomonadaceae bacterium]|jgi:sporulation integral membrane protein YtvI|nr:sporulation integral membrane protein YtvI [Bacillota bacterium]NLM87985.1 sporulation integral membrane protein YtvI [Syntrophomonadaceae bacterium]HAA08869.1 sporulation integral membrane protein YtvI [Syntrophomonas sp.]HQA49225.1 sporulation integral membrane protein YtvI [Syntrophomonadaceae bacterium]HQD89417.1 sporulation integral membrane protein YtvI [Syntrophomonadaceae bacterium]